MELKRLEGRPKHESGYYENLSLFFGTGSPLEHGDQSLLSNPSELLKFDQTTTNRRSL